MTIYISKENVAESIISPLLRNSIMTYLLWETTDGKFDVIHVKSGTTDFEPSGLMDTQNSQLLFCSSHKATVWTTLQKACETFDGTFYSF